MAHSHSALDPGPILSLCVTLCFHHHRIPFATINKGGLPREYQLCGGHGPWTILETNHWFSDALNVKQDDHILA